MKPKKKALFNSEDLIEDLEALKKHFVDRDTKILKAYAVVSIMKDSIKQLINAENEVLTYKEN